MEQDLTKYIDAENLIKLVSAETLQSIYPEAEMQLMLKSLAYTINSAANTGESGTLWQHELPDEVKTLLEKTYNMKCAKLLTVAQPGRLWYISWEK